EIFTIYKNGHELDRAGMLAKITTEVPKITQEDRNNEKKAEVEQAKKDFDAKLPHYGDFPVGDSARVRGLAIPTPKYSKFTTKIGPPDVVTVSLEAPGAKLREFYVALLPKAGWTAAGNCFERKNPVNSKTESLCLDPGNNQIVLNITEK